MKSFPERLASPQADTRFQSFSALHMGFWGKIPLSGAIVSIVQQSVRGHKVLLRIYSFLAGR